MKHKLVILVPLRYYLPGFRSGGPVRSVSNLVEQLGDEYDFRVVCLDRDLRETTPYPGVLHDAWTDCGKAKVLYLARAEVGLLKWRSLSREVQPDIVYLNSLLDRGFSILPMLAMGASRHHIVLAPRGELSLGALRLKGFRKRVFVTLARLSRLYSKIRWHATSETEMDDIRREFRPASDSIVLANNLPEESTLIGPRTTSKSPGQLRVAFLSRVSPKKNLAAAIRMVARLSGDVVFDLWGPIDDAAYWKRCQAEMAVVPKNILITWRGEVPHECVADTLVDYDVFLLPTLGENFGHSIVEALSAGLPVVVSDCTPWRGLREAGVGADLSLHDEGEFVQTLERFQAMDELAMAAVRDRCRAYIRQWLAGSTDLSQYRRMFGPGTPAGHA